MRSTVRATTIALTLSLAAGVLHAVHAQAASSGSIKIAYVNTQAIMEAAPGRDSATAILNREGQSFQVQLQKMQDSLNGMMQKFQKGEPTMTAAAKKKAQDDMNALNTELEAKNLQYQQQFQARTNEIMAPIQDVVRKVIEDLRVEGGYAMILDHTPGQTPIIAADKNLDITDAVVSRLRATARPALPTTPKAGAPAAPAGVTPKKPPTQ
jgi:outer membrane protein